MFQEKRILKNILQILYVEIVDGKPVLNPDKEWDCETIENVAQALKDDGAGFVPFHALSLKPENFIRIVWGIDDVQDRAKEAHEWDDMSDEVACDILETMKRRHDCENGINWDVIDVYIEDAKELDDECKVDSDGCLIDNDGDAETDKE